MPLSFPAHQAVVLPLKRRWPQRFDGLALVVGSAAPDLHRAVDPFYESLNTHDPLGITIFSVPFTLLYAAALRRRGLPGLFRLLPVGSALRRYSTISRRGPGLAITATSAYVGAFSHIIIDGFTHAGNPIARSVGLSTVLFRLLDRPVTPAVVLQYLGHTVGSLVGAYLLWQMARARPPVSPTTDHESTGALWAVVATYAAVTVVVASWWAHVSSAFPLSSFIFFSALSALGASMTIEAMMTTAGHRSLRWGNGR